MSRKTKMQDERCTNAGKPSKASRCDDTSSHARLEMQMGIAASFSNSNHVVDTISCAAERRKAVGVSSSWTIVLEHVAAACAPMLQQLDGLT